VHCGAQGGSIGALKVVLSCYSGHFLFTSSHIFAVWDVLFSHKTQQMSALGEKLTGNTAIG